MFREILWQIVKKQQIAEIVETIETFPKLSRTELAITICELFSWKRPTGKLKSVECRQFLEHLDEKGTIRLPACRKQYVNRSTSKVHRTARTDIQPIISTKLKDLSPILLIRVETHEQRQLWYEYVDRYHYLGYQLPLERNYAILLKSVQPMIFLAAFNFPVLSGRCRRGTNGLVGPMRNERPTCKKSLITTDFSFFPGFRSKILPVQFSRWRLKPSWMIGNAATTIIRFLWKHWLTGNDSEALVIRRPAGYTWVKRQAVDVWTVTINSMARRLRRFMFTPLHPDFVKNWQEAKGFRIYLLGRDRIVHVASWHQIQNEKQFGEDLSFVASRIPQDDLCIGLLGDGADWLWKHMVACFPKGRQILDYFHCAEYISIYTRWPSCNMVRDLKNVWNGWKVR